MKGVKFDLLTNSRRLLHGDTLHGLESLDPDLAGQPLSYYHETGPVGDVMRLMDERPAQHFGVVGLGTGSMAGWTAPNRHITFFDFDPLFHVSNRYMNVEGLISALVTHAGLETRVCYDEEQQIALKTRSHYIVAEKNENAMAVLLFKGDSPAVAERFAAEDPYVKNGLVKNWRVRPWTTVGGETASTPVR